MDLCTVWHKLVDYCYELQRTLQCKGLFCVCKLHKIKMYIIKSLVYYAVVFTKLQSTWKLV